jgi:PAS domain S-box-containing protein
VQRELAALFDATLHAVVALRAGRIVYANAAFVELAGQSSMLRGKMLAELVVASQREEVERWMAQDPAPLAVVIQTKSGMRAEMTALQFAWGGYSLLLLRSRQLVPSRRHVPTVPQNATADRPLWDVLERAGTGFWLVDNLGRTLVVNAHAAELLSTTMDALYGATLFDHLGLDVTGLPNGVHHIPLVKGDGVRVLEATWSQFHNEEGEPAGLFVLLRDITAHRQVVQELERSEGRFRALTETTPCAVCIMAPLGPVYEVNSAAERMFGYSRQEWMGGMVRAEHVCPDPHQLGTLLERLRRDGRLTTELLMQRRDGSRFLASASCTRVTQGKDELLAMAIWEPGLFAPAQSPSVMGQAHLLEIVRRIHDLAQKPLVSLHALLDMARQDAAQSVESIPAHLDGLERTSLRLSALLDDLYRLSSLTQDVFRPERTNLEDVVRAVATGVQPWLKERGATLQVMKPLPAVDADPRLLQSALSLMIVRLGARVPEGFPAHLTVGSVPRSHYMEVFVSAADASSPVPPDRLQSWLNLSNANDDGIALASIQRVAELHGGHFTVQFVDPCVRLVLSLPREV